MEQFLNKFVPDQVVKKIEILEDNKINLILTKDPENQNCIKHINVMYYHSQKLVDDRELKIKWI